jgi:2-polyprenyl-6-methoxyphenol hydroxylase-like FAD-dependent oxidoreductase
MIQFIALILVTIGLIYTFLKPYFKRIDVETSGLGKSSTILFNKVIVMGGSVGGLFAAATLSKHANQVIILEKSKLPGKNESIVPQGSSPHILLQHGLQIADRLLPGLKQALVDAGARATDFGASFYLHTLGGARKVSNDTGLHAYNMSRGLLESVIRSRIALLSNVEFREECQVTTLKFKEEDSALRITGVVYKDANDQQVELMSDLVVDCCGINTPCIRLFKDLFGIDVRKTDVKSYMAYSSAIFKVPQEAITHDIVYYMQVPPHQPYGCISYQVEGDNHYMVTSFSLNNNKVPTTVSGMEEIMASCKHDFALNIVKNGTQVSDIKTYKKEGSRWTHWEELRNIKGFIAMGDSVVSGNPIFGQGMSMAAEASIVLDDLLREQGYRASFCSEFQQRLSYVLTAPWILANTSDLQFKGTTGGSSVLRAFIPILKRGMDHQFLMGAKDQDYAVDFSHVMHMTKGWLKRLIIPLPIRNALGYRVSETL